MPSSALYQNEILIVGAGIIGLSLALELHARGAQVTIIEQQRALSSASTAAAGMLAAEDPHNPPALLPLSRYSLSLYPQFLQKISSLSGLSVPFQTDITLQHRPSGAPIRLAEHSIDPRQLAAALLAAVRSTSISLVEHTTLTTVSSTPPGITATTADARSFPASRIVYATGAWPLPAPFAHIPIAPRKGQMLRIALPASAPRGVHRSEYIYFVPRTLGPQAGSALIGATVEDAGFDLTTRPADLAHLREAIAALDPSLAFCRTAPQLEAWAGLRPSTPDGVPILGRIPGTSHFIATGHFRNGILLAPGTAHLLADLLEDRATALDLTPFAPSRFAP